MRSEADRRGVHRLIRCIRQIRVQQSLWPARGPSLFAPSHRSSANVTRAEPTRSPSVESEMIRLSPLPPRRAAARLMIGLAGLAVVGLPLTAQTVVQQGWNP